MWRLHHMGVAIFHNKQQLGDLFWGSSTNDEHTKQCIRGVEVQKSSHNSPYIVCELTVNASGA